MSTTFPLPLECLQMVIHHLAIESDRNSLASLLRVNKYVCSATLPVMYADPFRLRPFSFFSKETPTSLIKLLSLMKSLLLSLPEGQGVTDLLRVAYLSTAPASDGKTTEHQEQEAPPPIPATETTTTSIPYYSFLTHIDLEAHYFSGGGLFYTPQFPSNSAILDYLEINGHAERYTAKDVTGRLKHYEQPTIICQGVARDLGRDLTWALCVNGAECIQRLAIPISDISRYLAIVGRFKVLTNVTFLLDSDITPFLHFGQQLAEEDQEVLALQQRERERHIEEMILFVQEHCQRFPNTLTRGRCVKDMFMTEECPKEPVFERDSKQVGPFLHRCRALEDIDIRSPSEDAFRWAVEERKWFERDIADGRTTPSRRPLVPLRQLYVGFEDHPSSGGLFDDAVFAFQETLEDICVSICESREYSLDQVNYWEPAKLPRLESLKLQGTAAISFHPDTLKYALELQALCLEADQDEDHMTYFIPPAEELDAIAEGESTVDGGGSNSVDGGGGDNVDNDETSSVLRTLARRPVWTWDWALPKLTFMTLTGEHAYRFQFRMLEGTPSLIALKLDIASTTALHQRTIHLEDLIKPGSQQQRQQKHDGEEVYQEQQDQEYIHVATLKRLSLYGPWRMTTHVLQTLFSRVAPEIANLAMSSCLDHDFSEWVDATKQYLHGLVAAELNMDVSEDAIADAGLVRAKMNRGRYSVGYQLEETPLGRMLETPACYNVYEP
ncbi:hypothetical protein BGZ90_011107 [Linnemannia elongata]|nr:hypothetical protein BGZ90_011107 [Linnemannia elongata]